MNRPPRLYVLAVLCPLAAAAASRSGAADLCQGLVKDKVSRSMTPLAKPALAQTVIDPQFGTTLRRITAVAAVGANPAIVPLYSTVSAWNADESRLILYHVGIGHELYAVRTSTLDAPEASPSGTMAFTGGYVLDPALNVLRQLDLANPYEHASLGRLASGHDTYNGVAFDPGPGGSGVGSLVTFDLTNGSS